MRPEKPNREKEPKRYISAPQLAQRWSISRAHAYRMVERGELPGMRIGCAVRIPLEAVEAFERRSNDAA